MKREKRQRYFFNYHSNIDIHKSIAPYISSGCLLNIRRVACVLLTMVLIMIQRVDTSFLGDLMFLSEQGFVLTWLYFLLTLQHHHISASGYHHTATRTRKVIQTLFEMELYFEVPITIIEWILLFEDDLLTQTTEQSQQRSWSIQPLSFLSNRPISNPYRFERRRLALIVGQRIAYPDINLDYSLNQKPDYDTITWQDGQSYIYVVAVILLIVGTHFAARAIYTKFKRPKKIKNEFFSGSGIKGILLCYRSLTKSCKMIKTSSISLYQFVWVWLGFARSCVDSIRLTLFLNCGVIFVTQMKISNDAISNMFRQGSGQGAQYVVQALSVKAKNEYLRLDIKDGSTTVKAVIYLTRPGLNILENCPRIDNQDRYYISIKEFKTHTKNEKLMLEILDFVPLNQNMAPNTKIQQFAELSIKKEAAYRQPQAEYKTEKKDSSGRRPVEPSTDSQEPEDIMEDELKQFEKINDLYIGFQGKWEIVVRVIEKSYREFNNKSGKLTKIFSMTMVDRAGMKIDGVMFGDNAREYHDLIHLNRIYRVSRGQIREENYNQSKRKDYSKYNLIFNKDSSFIPVREISCIPKASNADPSLQDIIAENDLDKISTLSLVLLEIGEERNIQRGDRTIFKKSLLVGDPETRKSIDVVIWNKDLYINPMWVDKTIVLKNFKLHNYRETLSFSSIFRSEICPAEGHRFNRLEGKVAREDYEPISEQRDDNRQQDGRFNRFVKEIEAEVMYSNSMEPVYSDLEVWITHMSFKNKWFYDACNNPKCKKTAQSGQKCMNCGHFNEIVQRRFIIPIELSDCTGSIWTTAFDELSHEIFKGTNIQELSRMEEGRLKEEAECRLYQQFKLRISSRKEVEGNVRHSIVGKVSEVNVERASTSNVEKIKKAMF